MWGCILGENRDSISWTANRSKSVSRATAFVSSALLSLVSKSRRSKGFPSSRVFLGHIVFSAQPHASGPPQCGHSPADLGVAPDLDLEGCSMAFTIFMPIFAMNTGGIIR